MRNYLFILFLSSLSFVSELFSQNTSDTSFISFANRSENSFAVLLNSNGYGFNYHHGKRLDGFNRALFSVDISEVKHSKEVKVINPYFNNSSKKFVFGKLNEVFLLRLSYGRFKILFDKFGKGGISVNRFWQAGLSTAFIKPVYYYVLYPTSDPNYKILREEKFNYDMHRITDIYSKANFFDHIEETVVLPGVFLRYGYSFDFSSSEYKVNSLECGIQLDGYPSKIQIMAASEGTFYFFSLFVAYRYGKATAKRINYNK